MNGYWAGVIHSLGRFWGCRCGKKSKSDRLDLSQGVRMHKLGRMEQAIPYVRMKQLCARFGVTRHAIYAWMYKANFPKPLHIGYRIALWRIADVDAWAEQRAAKKAGYKKESPA